jgi:acetoin:2,6-dichlorophenolindophenol oxidoreductase subunit beta
MKELSLLQAAREGLNEELKIDTNTCFLKTENALNKKGDRAADVTDADGQRVINMPKSQATIISSATGLALIGMRPIIELSNTEDVYLSFSALLDQAAKLRYMSGGKLQFPITYLIIEDNERCDFNVLHSDSPYSFLLHGGMKVVIPSCAYDAKGLLVSAIRDNDPVAVFLPTRSLSELGEVPEEQYNIPLGEADIKREGKDVTVITTGHLVKEALNAAQKLEKEDVSVEVFDARSLLPLDTEALEKSIAKTGRAVIMDDSPITCGFGNFVASVIAEEFFSYLKAPVKIVARADMPVPFNRTLEEYVIPNEEKLIFAIKKII